jgi:hypothetical protein
MGEQLDELRSRRSRSAVAWAWGIAALGVTAAVYYYTGDACKSSAGIDALLVAPVLLGVAAFLFVTRRAPRWLLGLAAGVGVVVASSAIFVVLAFLHLAESGCTIG